jgi:alpha-L-rhamnosidase
VPAWYAQMITADEDFAAAPQLRTEFRLDPDRTLRRAVLRYTALGICEAWINGHRVSDDLFTPGWTSYEWRVRFAESDVTALLEPHSAIGLVVGNGWYRGTLGWTGQRAVYGDRLATFAQLDIEYTDGHRQVVGTDSSWRCAAGPITANDLYDGQNIDARLRDDRWLRPGFEPDDAWHPVTEIDFDTALLRPFLGPPVRRTGTIAPQRVWASPGGATLVDFGQNIAGWLRLRVKGRRGEQVTVRHAEVLENDELGTRPLRRAAATDSYTLSGGADEFEPTLTFHGFRYAEITGWPADVPIDAHTVGAVVVGNDLARIGTFECSNPLLNRLHDNVVWSMRGNFLSVPTDCPQRDERLGWTGDIAVFAPTAAFLYDVNGFLRDWLVDLALEQAHAGSTVPMVVPDALKYLDGAFGIGGTVAIWGDAAVWVPWALWQAYGDATVLADQFESMLGHARAMAGLLSPSGLWDRGIQLGDWLDPDAPPDRPRAAKAHPGVVATACAYRTATMLAQTAQLLGRHAEHEEFAGLAHRIRRAFNGHYVADGIVTSDCPTVYALAIVFDLLSGSDRQVAGARLVDLVTERGFRISTGFAGTPYLTDALTLTGHTDTAYRLLLEQGCPSWLYPVTMGATTIWERWDSMLPDGSINPGNMTSFNHYALGAVADWMHRSIGGLASLEPGYRSILIAPHVGGDLTWAATSLATPHGLAATRWELDGTDLRLDVTIPDGTSAIVRLPGRPDRPLPAGRHRFTVPAPIAAPALG